MRLIDADKLQPDRMTNRGTVAISQSQIAHAPTVDVLDKIRDEIEQNKNRDIGGNCEQWVNGYRVGMNEALVIIDKYTAESEDKG